MRDKAQKRAAVPLQTTCEVNDSGKQCSGRRAKFKSITFIKMNPALRREINVKTARPRPQSLHLIPKRLAPTVDGRALTMLFKRYCRLLSGSSSAVERQLPKLDVAGSIPVSRSILEFSRVFMAAI